jgi:hypothetical protein
VTCVLQQAYQGVHKEEIAVPPGSKYKVNRKDMIEWIEEAVSELNEKAVPERKIAQMFTKLGQDPRDLTGQHFLANLSGLCENYVYKALLDRPPRNIT